jgi:hypothetical protein
LNVTVTNPTPPNTNFVVNGPVNFSGTTRQQ